MLGELGGVYCKTLLIPSMEIQLFAQAVPAPAIVIAAAAASVAPLTLNSVA